MARLITAGAELEADDKGGAAGINGAPQTVGAGNALTYDTTVKRSGAASYKCVTGATAGSAQIQFNVSILTAVTGFCRGYIYVPSSVGWPASGGQVAMTATAVNALISEVRISSTGVATLWVQNAQVGTGSIQLQLDTWHRIEHKALITAAGTTDVFALQVDGISVVPDTTVSAGTSVVVNCRWGANGANAASITNFTVYADDIAINDSSGTSQNGYPGAGSVVMLKPASDNARTNWTTDSTGTTNLWDAENNVPPVGVADTTVGSGLQQIRDAISSTTDNYDANLQTYTAAGVPTGSTVTLVQACAIASAASATSPPSMALFLVSNAGGTTEGSETTLTVTAAASTWPTGWAPKKNAVLVMTAQPTLTSAPVLRFGKRTASTRIAMCCFMGLIVEYVPPPLPAGQAHGRHLAARSFLPARGRF